MSDLFGQERDFDEGEAVAVLTTEPLDRYLDYRAPFGGVDLGALVEVPLGPRRVLGAVWGPGQGGFDRAKLRSIIRVLDEPAIPAPMRDFLARAADYTITPLSQMLRLATRAPGLMHPPGDTKVLVAGTAAPDRMTPAREKVLALVEDYGGLPFQPGELANMAGVSGSVIKGLVAQGCLVEVFAPRDGPFPALDPGLPGAALNAEQAVAAEQLRAGVASGTYGTTLLKGVTGSGKTEVYLEAVAEALRLGQQALVLLPEIALSVEFMARVEKRFGARPAEWHSGVTMAERRRAWKAVARGQAQLVVGARSALFLPFRHLGVIVVDEEHDGSYKQEDGVHYHARDMAVLRASILGAQVVLASATPSLETWANAQAGKYARLDLAERFGVAEMPELSAIDMRTEPMQPNQWISPMLADAVAQRMADGEQALLFLNRRGFAPLTLCRACGHQIGCEYCDARMVEHRFLARLVCHQCGESKPVPAACPSCAVEGKLAPIGPGVERLAEEVAARFPDARIAVLSSDMAGSTRAMKARILEIAQGGADIIIGTQMVAKGHNFPLLTLVGVIDADLGLEGGDLRAAEKSFQLIRQVAGRAGRADKPGQALIQSHQPDHPLIKAIIAGDEEAFWAAEAASRARAGAPPYGRMAGIVLSGPDEGAVYALAREMAQAWAGRAKIDSQLFGPAAAPVARIRGRHRVRMLIKTPKGAPIQEALRRWTDGLRLPANIRLTIDIDPQSFY
ncbi:primosomal protein N' [Abyssibius alkaniclasticus]|uniref:primosomal protein N' n=1 Tax=Abyssibius alkaniclasticus TaxID=2881234 RepID=UPI002363E5D1|nr:primosomal protein N' [Abyssibius alkaniclasticus]UPH71564.1 primosomal protein N' [Abyssibius alkaniclasticus]